MAGKADAANLTQQWRFANSETAAFADDSATVSFLFDSYEKTLAKGQTYPTLE